MFARAHIVVHIIYLLQFAHLAACTSIYNRHIAALYCRRRTVDAASSCIVAYSGRKRMRSHQLVRRRLCVCVCARTLQSVVRCRRARVFQLSHRFTFSPITHTPRDTHINFASASFEFPEGYVYIHRAPSITSSLPRCAQHDHRI